jgi:hypothetical protein
MVFCFLALHDIILVPRNIAYPPIDLLSSSEHVQSASKNPLINNDLHLAILRPIQMEPLKYRKILFTVVQCTVVGACKYRQTLLTAKEILGFVRLKYCNAPIML